MNSSNVLAYFLTSDSTVRKILEPSFITVFEALTPFIANKEWLDEEKLEARNLFRLIDTGLLVLPSGDKAEPGEVVTSLIDSRVEEAYGEQFYGDTILHVYCHRTHIEGVKMCLKYGYSCFCLSGHNY